MEHPKSCKLPMSDVLKELFAAQGNRRRWNITDLPAKHGRLDKAESKVFLSVARGNVRESGDTRK